MNLKKMIIQISLFLVLLTTNAHALYEDVITGDTVYEFQVDNPTMVDAYWNIFNAMAALFSNEEYLSLLKLVFLVGGFIVFFGGILKSMQGGSPSSGITEFTKYMLIGVTMLTLLFSNSTKIVVTSNVLPSFCEAGGMHESLIESSPATGVIVGGIPQILGWGFEFMNKIGTKSTQMAEMAFSDVTSISAVGVSRNEYASYLYGISKINAISFNDISGNTKYSNGETFGVALDRIVNDCIMIPAGNDSVHGEMILSAIQTTGDLQRTIDDLLVGSDIITYKNPTCVTNPIAGNVCETIKATDIKYQNLNEPGFMLSDLFGSTYTCREAWQNYALKLNSLKAGGTNEGAIECLDSMKDYLNPTTLSILTGDTTAATKPQAQSIALNSAIANQMLDQRNDLAAGEISYAAGKSMSEFVTNSFGTGYYMAQMLPYLQMGMRAVLYAFFPFVFVVVLLPGGIKVLISYIQTLIWIELWAPTAAILNMFISLMAKEKFSDMYQDKGMNKLNGVQTLSDAAMLASVGGYLYASVPALTWLILKGSGQMLGNVSGAMAAGMTANMQSDSINRDMQLMDKHSKLNQIKRSKGEDMISLASMEREAAQYAGHKEAGEQSSNERYAGNLASITEALENKKSAIGDGTRGADFAAMTTEELEKNKTMSKTQIDKGNVTTDGSPNNKQIDIHAGGNAFKNVTEQEEKNQWKETAEGMGETEKSVAAVTNTEKEVDLKAKQNIQDGINVDTRVEAAYNEALIKAGSASALKDKNLTALNSLSKNGTEEQKKLANDYLSKINKGGKGAERAHMEAAGDMSVIGETARMSNAVKSDVQSIKQTENGFTGAAEGKYDAETKINKVDTESELYYALQDSKGGQEALNKAMKELGFSEEDLEGEAGRINRAPVATRAAGMLKTGSDAYNTVSEAQKVADLNEAGFTTEKNASAKSFQTQVAGETSLAMNKGVGVDGAVLLNLGTTTVGALRAGGYLAKLGGNLRGVADDLAQGLPGYEKGKDKLGKSYKNMIDKMTPKVVSDARINNAAVKNTKFKAPGNIKY